MAMNRAVFGGLAVACVVAAGGGAYLALRPSAPPPVATAATAPAQDQILPPQSAPGAVTETEGVIDDTASSGPAPASPSASSQRPAARPSDTARTESREPRSSTTESARSASAARPAADASVAAPGDSTRARGLDKPWPTGAASNTASAPEPPAADPEPAPMPAAVVETKPAMPEPPQKVFEDLVVSADSVLGLQVETAVTSEKAKVEDRVQARVTRDVKVGDRVAIPAGSRAEGSITLVEKGGKFKERARLGIRFHTLVLADGTRLGLNTETIFRDGAAPSGESTAKVGGAAVGGAILGAIFGGSRGAVVGGTVGAAGGTAAVMAGDRNAATLPAGSTLTIRLTSPVTVTVED